MRVIGAISCWLLVLGIAASSLAAEWELVAREGSDAPPIPSPHTFDLVGNVTLRNDGTVFFYGFGASPPVTALYRWSSRTGVELVSRFDLPAGPLGDPPVLVAAHPRALSSGYAGRVLVDRDVQLTACPGFLYEPEATFAIDEMGEPQLLVSPGAPVPGLEPGWIYGWGQGALHQLVGPVEYDSTTPLVGEGGDVAFFAAIVKLDPCEEDPFAPYAHALFGPDGQGGSTLVAMPDQDAPGAPSGTKLTPVSLVAPNAAGELALGAQLQLGPTQPIAAIYRWDVGRGLRLVAREGDSDPDGHVFEAPSNFELGDGGHVVFDDIDASMNTYHGLFLQTPELETRTLVESGDVLPGAPDLRVRYGYSKAVNAAGDVAFSMNLTPISGIGAEQVGAWSPNGAGETVLRLLTGQPAPLLDGLTIDQVSVMALSDERRLAILASVEGPGVVVGHNDDVYYLVEPDGTMQILARDGELYDLGRGAPEPVRAAFLGFVADDDLQRFAMLGFSDPFERVILYKTLPEPGDLAGALAALALLIVRRRR